MSRPTPIFATGPARSGSTLVARMLDAHPRVAVASDPLFPLLKAALVAILRDAAIPGLAPGGPIPDWHFADARVAALDAVLAGTLDLAVPDAEWPALREALAARAAHEAPALAPGLGRLAGGTYAEAIAAALALVARAAGGGLGAAGTKEVWTIDLLPALARAFPDARFVVVLRDPRAIVASLEAMARKDPTQGAHSLSYARHWRKHVALLGRFAEEPALAGRLLLVRYEQAVADPISTAEALAAHVGVGPDAAMAAADGHAANTSYEAAGAGIRPELAGRWRETLDPRARAMVELVCGPELALVGYDCEPDAWREHDVLGYLREGHVGPSSWRSDLGEPGLDYQLELDRRTLLACRASAEPDVLRRAFLFEGHWRRLRETSAARVPAGATA